MEGGGVWLSSEWTDPVHVLRLNLTEKFVRSVEFRPPQQ